MTRSPPIIMLSFPHLAEAVGSTQRKFLQRFLQAAITLLMLHMSWMCLAPGVHEGCTAPCTQSLYHPLSLVVLSQASLSSYLAPLKTHFGAFPSRNQLTIQLSLAVPGSPTSLGLEKKMRKERRDHWSSGTSHQDGMNSCNAGALISVGECRLPLSRTFSLLLQRSLLLVHQHLRNLLNLIMTRWFFNSVRLAKICSPWITGILCLHSRLSLSAWAALTLNWHVNRKENGKRYRTCSFLDGIFLWLSRMGRLCAVSHCKTYSWLEGAEHLLTFDWSFLSHFPPSVSIGLVCLNDSIVHFCAVVKSVAFHMTKTCSYVLAMK